MRRYWIAVFITCAVVLAGMMGAEAAIPACTGVPGQVVLIDNAADALTVATNGYSCQTADLTITVDLPSGAGGPPMATNLDITAASITITGASGNTTDIINNNPGSKVNLTAKNGNITLNFAKIKAHSKLFIVCTSPQCKFKSDNSEIVAATNFNTPVDGGDLGIYSVGPVDIHTTFLHGGDTMHIESSASSVTVICGAGSGGVCTDPIVSKSPAKCFPGGVFTPPCTITTEDELHSVCFPGTPGVVCNGGFKEKGIFAFTDIHIEGSSLKSTAHMNFTAKTGKIFMAGAVITGDDLLYFDAANGIDMKDAVVSAASSLTFWSHNCPGSPCIDAQGATTHSGGSQTFLAGNYNGVINLCQKAGGTGGIFEEDGGGTIAPPTYIPPLTLTGTFPAINLFNQPPYGAEVKYRPADCPTGKARFCSGAGCQP